MNFLLVWVAIGLFPILVVIYGTWKVYRAQLPPLRSARFPGISILKPLKGLEAGLGDNLRSFFRIEYPEFELLFAVAEETDPAVPLVREVMAEYPGVRARLLIGDDQIGINPKVNNLWKVYNAAQYDCVLVSDSNIRVQPGFLAKMAPYLEDPKVGIVTWAVSGIEGTGLGGKIESSYLNTHNTRWVFMAETFGHPFVLGKSMLLRKSNAERFGGLRNLGRHIAEDYMTGVAIHQLGLKVIVAPDQVEQYLGQHSLVDFWSRHLRWGRIRKSQIPIPFILEPLTHLVVICAILLFAGATFNEPLAIWAVALQCGVYLLCDSLLEIKVGKRLNWDSLLGWFLREALAFPHWLHMASGSTISWRGRKMKLGPGGTIQYELKSSLSLGGSN